MSQGKFPPLMRIGEIPQLAFPQNCELPRVLDERALGFTLIHITASLKTIDPRGNVVFHVPNADTVCRGCKRFHCPNHAHNQNVSGPEATQEEKLPN